MSVSAHRIGVVFGAFAYLQATSLYNNLRQRLLRLRQPKYLIGALVGGAYLYFFLFHRMARVGNGPMSVPGVALPQELLADFASLAALALAVYVLAEWIFSNARSQLAFTEAEIEFLFPAPLTRTALIHFGLLRSQLAIFFSSFLLGLLFRRGGGFSGHPLQFATGLWLLFSMVKLHAIGASFTRERLLELGVRPWLRRLLAACIAIAITVACAWPMRAVLHAPSVAALSDFGLLRQWYEGIVGTAPLSWLLAPFRWVVAPIFAPDGASFLRALWPALALLVAHYLWVVRAQVSFEEASIAHARKRAERVAAMREGRMRQRMPTKPRGEPFRLAGQGESWVAFVWKGLLAMGSLYRLRSWIVACVVVVAGCRWMHSDPELSRFLLAAGTALVLVGAWLLLLAPMMLQHQLRRTFERLDVLKALPMRGWQIALGEVATPALVMSFSAWWLILLATQVYAPQAGHGVFAQVPLVLAGLCVALPVAPLCALVLCVPFAGMLLFPAWIVAPGAGGHGIEVMGQRMVFMFGYVFVALLAMLPAAVLGGIGLLLGKWLGGWGVATVLAALGVTVALVVELAAAVRMLGYRVDRFDLSQELR